MNINYEKNLNGIIYGIENTENIVSIEYYLTTSGNNTVIFKEKDGIVTREFRKYPITCLNKNRDENFNEVLEGDQPYKYRYQTYDYQDFKDKRKTKESFGIWRFDENIMSRFGLTYFKGMKSIKEVSALSFDLETTGLEGSADDAKIVIISNTLDKNGIRTRKLFAIDDFESEKKMLEAWCTWVREVNPTIILGHNIYNFDIPYLLKRAYILGTLINIGRDLSPLYLEGFQSQFRKDQITFISYRKPQCFGRQIIDTWLMAMDHDRISQKYPNYKLKDIAKFEKIEAQSRVYYDASLIRKNWMIPEEMAKIKIYAENDADEALDLYYIVCGTKFLITPHIPKGYQNVTLSATGSLCNSLMVRAYNQINHSIAEASDKESYEGAVSYGNEGIYKNVFKIDVSSLYPSIMLTYKIEDPVKDPCSYFLKMVKYFTEQRLINKSLAKETGDKYYSNLEQVQKIFINSFYGFLGAAGLNYNHMYGASEVTRIGREIILFTVKWATGELPDNYYEDEK